MRVLHAAAAAVIVHILVLAPVPAGAVTVEQVVALSKAGVSEAVILALLDRDRTVLTIDPEQLVSLKREGLSDGLITAMLKSGRDDADAAAQAVSAANAASVLAAIDATPGFVVVGHGPDRPNTIHTEDGYRGFRDGVRLPSAASTHSPYTTGRGRALAARTLPSLLPGRFEGPHERMLCLAQVNTPRGAGPAYITECPAVMQRALRSR